MIIIGVTGSIGMGKTTVATMISDMTGAVTHNADDEVHHLLNAGGQGVAAVQKLFPPDHHPHIYEEESINRAALGELIFKDEGLRQKLEEALHPLVRAAQKTLIQTQKESHSDIVVLDVPLLFETGGDQICDVTLVASASADIQKTRVMARPNMSEEKFTAILNRQMGDEEKRKRADHIIDTGVDLEQTRAQIETIINHIKKDAAHA